MQLGNDAAALAAYEASMRCTPDEALFRFAFMAACRAKDWPKAKRYFSKVPATQSQGIMQICIRNGFDPTGDDVAATDTGTLEVHSTPVARILIDGKLTGKTTPATFDLPAGTHKVTYDLGGHRFTFSVHVKAGSSLTLTKDLR
jgi:hypothetical protein